MKSILRYGNQPGLCPRHDIERRETRPNPDLGLEEVLFWDACSCKSLLWGSKRWEFGDAWEGGRLSGQLYPSPFFLSIQAFSRKREREGRGREWECVLFYYVFSVRMRMHLYDGKDKKGNETK